MITITITSSIFIYLAGYIAIGIFVLMFSAVIMNTAIGGLDILAYAFFWPIILTLSFFVIFANFFKGM